MGKKLDVFRHGKDTISSMRVAMMICTVVALMIAITGTVIWAIYGRELSGIVALVASILTAAFGGKSIQSFSENRHQPPPPK